jgi:ABC-type antimicrobial peptide transport system permease subunit
MREFAIRMVVGADPGSLLQMVLKKGLFLAGLGIVLGLVAGWFCWRFASSLLFGVAVSDPATLAAAALLLLAVVVLAVSIPAIRATRIAPMTILRDE